MVLGTYLLFPRAPSTQVKSNTYFGPESIQIGSTLGYLELEGFGQSNGYEGFLHVRNRNYGFAYIPSIWALGTRGLASCNPPQPARLQVQLHPGAPCRRRRLRLSRHGTAAAAVAATVAVAVAVAGAVVVVAVVVIAVVVVAVVV